MLHNASIYSDAFAIAFKRYTTMFECKYIIIACEWMCGRCICVLRGEYRDTTASNETNKSFFTNVCVLLFIYKESFFSIFIF